MNENQIQFMREAIRLSVESVKNGGGPFGAIIVKNGEIIARGNNQVTLNHDPTAHAEVVAIREACQHLGHFQLEDCDLYTSCEPCPMCMGAIYWSRPNRVFFGNTKSDAAKIGFDDQFIYKELQTPFLERKIPMIQLLNGEAIEAFQLWDKKEDKVSY
ncbi:MAG: nucleoside deaminase [Bacteroidetes bacterium]|nr:nucleoside deaminase [Bacteroidota bacterium]